MWMRLLTAFLVLSAIASCTVKFGKGEDGGDGGQACGNGILEPGEACDDGNTVNGDKCRRDCLQDLTLCGNGQLDLGEGCDDGNQDDGDGCSAACQAENCGSALCPQGCCDGAGICLAGTSDQACGSGGQLCQDCTATGRVCRDQQCHDPVQCTPGNTQDCNECGRRQCDTNGQWGPCQPQYACPPALDATVQCDSNGWCDYDCTTRTHGGKTYYFCSIRIVWVDARNACTARGLHLVTMDDGTENDWVGDTGWSLWGSGVGWIGFNDRAQENHWVWADGSPVGYTNWYTDQPDNSDVPWPDEDCAMMGWFDRYTWNDLNCEYEMMSFVCEEN